MEISKAKELLQSYYADQGQERCGFIVGEIIKEVPNIAPDPINGFEMRTEDIIMYATGEAWATWHTHPNATPNLSGQDYSMFKNWPKLVHFVVGKNEVKCYSFDKNTNAILEVGI